MLLLYYYFLLLKINIHELIIFINFSVVWYKNTGSFKYIIVHNGISKTTISSKEIIMFHFFYLHPLNTLFSIIKHICSTEVPGKPVGPIKFTELLANSVTLAWAPPKKDGGCPVTSYTIELTEDNKNWRKIDSVEATHTIYTSTDLKEGQQYKFRVCAINSVGPSEPLVSDSVVPERKIGKRFSFWYSFFLPKKVVCYLLKKVKESYNIYLWKTLNVLCHDFFFVSLTIESCFIKPENLLAFLTNGLC